MQRHRRTWTWTPPSFFSLTEKPGPLRSRRVRLKASVDAEVELVNVGLIMERDAPIIMGQDLLEYFGALRGVIGQSANSSAGDNLAYVGVSAAFPGRGRWQCLPSTQWQRGRWQ